MKTINKLAIVSLSSLAFSSTAYAAQQPVAKLLDVTGKAIVETANGTRHIAKSGMQISEGSNVILLEKAKVAMSYFSSGCKIAHGQNTLLTVLETAQCAPGQQIAVGAAAAAAGSAAGAATTTVAAGAAAAAGAGAAAAGAGAAAAAGAIGLGTAGLVAAGVAAVATVATVANNNDEPPASP